MSAMGLQVRPRGTLLSVGIPMLLAIGAPSVVLEFLRLLQQYSFLGADLTGPFEGLFEGFFDGGFEESFEGLFEGLFKGLLNRCALTVDKRRPGRETYLPAGAARAPIANAARTNKVLENIFVGLSTIGED